MLAFHYIILYTDCRLHCHIYCQLHNQYYLYTTKAIQNPIMPARNNPHTTATIITAISKLNDAIPCCLSLAPPPSGTVAIKGIDQRRCLHELNDMIRARQDSHAIGISECGVMLSSIIDCDTLPLHFNQTVAVHCPWPHPS